MNKETAENLFRLLRAFIYDENPVLIQPDWEEIFSYAGIHSVKGIVGYVCTKYNLCKEQAAASRAEKYLIETYGRQYRRASQMKRLICLLDETQIDHILMKGYIVKDVYPIPELRTYGDIDFVIHKESRFLTDRLMKQSGFRCTHDWEPVYSYEKDTEKYEIHTEVLDYEIAEGKQIEYFADVWKHVKHIGGHSYEMIPEYHFVYLIAHLAKHAARRGAGIRMYLDIALYIKRYRDSFDWGYITEQLKKLRLERFFNTICLACKQWFHVSPPIDIEIISKETFALFTDITISGGIFGYQNSNAGLSQLKEMHQEYSNSDKMRLIFNQLFPPADEIEKRYVYLQKRHWLLPIAYIDRLIRNRKLLKRKAGNIKEVMKADENEVRKLRDLNEKIGL